VWSDVCLSVSLLNAEKSHTNAQFAPCETLYENGMLHFVRGREPNI
jgi:hypothetical protein